MSSASVPAATRSTLRELGPHFVIAPPGAEAQGLAAALAPLDRVPGALLVLAAATDAAPVLRGRLADLAQAADNRGAEALVIAASGLAAPGARGRRPAEQLAELAGLAVIAPDSAVTIDPDGSLRTADGSWWRCHAARPAERLGERWPAPPAARPPRAAVPAQPVLPVDPPVDPPIGPARVVASSPAPVSMRVGAGSVPVAPAAAASLLSEAPTVPAAQLSEAPTVPTPAPAVPAIPMPTVTPLVGGYWVTTAPPGPPPAVLDAAAGAPHSLLLVLGLPGDPALPTAEQLAALVGALLAGAAAGAQPLPDRLLLSAPWATPARLTGLATVLCATLEREVHLAVGLPLRTASGDSALVLDAAANPVWEPCLTELAASPTSRTVTPTAWRARPGAWTPVGPAVHQLFPGWHVEAVPAGIWLRPADLPSRPVPAARRREPDPARPVLIVGHPGQPVPEELWDHLGGLLTALPPLGGEALGLLVDGVMDPETEAVARFSARLYKLHWLTATAQVTAAQAEADAEAATAEVEAEVAVADAEAATAEVEAEVAVAEPAPTPVPAPEQPIPAPVAVPTTATVEPPTPVDPLPPVEPPTPFAVEPPVPVETATQEEPPPPVAEEPPTPEPPTPEPPATPLSDQEALQALLGPAYHRWASRAQQLATRLPSLRTTATTATTPSTTDLVAVLLHHHDSPLPATRAELAEAARSGDERHPLLPYLRCLAAGLRRLPSHHGAVLVPAPAGPVDLDRYTPGTEFTEAAAVTALPALDLAPEPDTEVEFAVWSTTGRRTTACGEPADEPLVVFAPGTRFTVLEVHPADFSDPAAPRPARVLLHESPSRTAKASPDRLRAWLERRDAVTPADLRGPLPEPERHRPAHALGQAIK
ncbi:hypothetical protein ACFYNO_24045 [Kitasatospora sp. NPDC006697]|uniref:hypothetical protein n=1 Tax=Kitasatospora sp. NPDC006697 TaxID=3364020 RepID=UPI0036C13E79